MLMRHAGNVPHVDPTAWVAPTAVLTGAVTVGPGTRIMHGVVVTAHGSAEVTIGSECVVMEHAVLRAAGRWPLTIGDRSLVGPHAYLTGCSVGARSFIATGAMIFNGARLGEACVVALGGKVHIDTELGDDGRVPMGFIAVGRPAVLYAPDEAPSARDAVDRIGFMSYVFGVDLEGRSRAEIMDEAMTRYARALGGHRDDEVVG
jgi:carbonic anhydrase/acetyltransferase-like protein (isoleucine patch superfamily)